MNCAFDLIEGINVCRHCGRRMPDAPPPLRSTCRAAPPDALPPDPTACLHRGPIVREIACGSCGGELRLPIYGCALHGECSLRDYTRYADFAGIAVCQSCPDRKPVEPELPAALKRAAHLAADVARDLAAGRPRRSPAEIREIFSAHCQKCPRYNSAAQACSLCGCPVSAEEPEANRIAWAALHCPDQPPRW